MTSNEHKSALDMLQLPNQPSENDSVVGILCEKLEHCMQLADCNTRSTVTAAKTPPGVAILEEGEGQRYVKSM